MQFEMSKVNLLKKIKMRRVLWEPVLFVIIVSSLLLYFRIHSPEPICPICPDCPQCLPPPPCPTFVHPPTSSCPVPVVTKERHQNQVVEGTSFCTALKQLANRQDVHRFLEIGTWYGGGSSLCIAQELAKRNGTKLYTIEMFEEAWLEAREVLKDYPVRCILGGTVPVSDYLKPSDMTPYEVASEHFEKYYFRDLALAEEYEPMLEPLCKHHAFDAVLMDGNEYTGWAEFQIIKEVCCPRYLAMHDCGTLKTRKVQAWLDSAEGLVAGWRRLQNSFDYGTGADQVAWAVYHNVLR